MVAIINNHLAKHLGRCEGLGVLAEWLAPLRAVDAVEPDFDALRASLNLDGNTVCNMDELAGPGEENGGRSSGDQ